MTNVWFALGLTVFAGLATGVGSAIAFFAKSTNYRFLSVSTGFSAGIMLYVSFVEIFSKGVDDLVEAYGDYWGALDQCGILLWRHVSDRHHRQPDTIGRESA